MSFVDKVELRDSGIEAAAIYVSACGHGQLADAIRELKGTQYLKPAAEQSEVSAEPVRRLKPGPYKSWCEEHEQAAPCLTCDYETVPAEAQGGGSQPRVFEPEEVLSLNDYQVSGVMHPFTCKCGADLVATIRGWICCLCDYTQDWAHDWMKDEKWRKLKPAASSETGKPFVHQWEPDFSEGEPSIDSKTCGICGSDVPTQYCQRKSVEAAQPMSEQAQIIEAIKTTWPACICDHKAGEECDSYPIHVNKFATLIWQAARAGMGEQKDAAELTPEYFAKNTPKFWSVAIYQGRENPYAQSFYQFASAYFEWRRAVSLRPETPPFTVRECNGWCVEVTFPSEPAGSIATHLVRNFGENEKAARQLAKDCNRALRPETGVKE